jgi:predicted transposase/invertase (TIGR01784 family)
MAKKRTDNKKKKAQKAVNSHDAFFKGMFSKKEIVERYIERFVSNELVAHLDLSSLELLPTSYVTDDLEEFFADLVWKANYHNGGIVEIALLFEHKSYIPEYGEVQILRYWVEGISEQIKNKENLRVIIPILIYHGEGEWKVRQIADYFKGIDETLRKFVPSFDYCVTNVSSYSDNELINMELGKLLNVFLALIHIRDTKYILENFKTLFIFAEQYLPDKGNFLQMLFVYLFRNVELNDEHWEQVLNTFDTPLKDFSMSAYFYFGTLLFLSISSFLFLCLITKAFEIPKSESRLFRSFLAKMSLISATEINGISPFALFWTSKIKCNAIIVSAI